MKKIILAILLHLLFIPFTHSQNTGEKVCVGDVTLSSQAEVDAFDCTEVTGLLIISGPDITNLDGLSSLKRVGSLFIQNNSSLTNVDGLYSLTSVTAQIQVSSVIIADNPLLNNLDGLSSLATISGPVEIGDNPELKSINGFCLLTTINGFLNIMNNDALISLDGFRRLTSILPSGFNTAAGLDIQNNASLANLDGFSSLRSIRGAQRGTLLFISDNNSLTNIDGLSALTALDGNSIHVGIINNAALRNLNGLSSLTHLQWLETASIVIENNAVLENIDGLSPLKYLDGPSISLSITLAKNPQLTRCCGLLPLLESLGDEISQAAIEITENGAGCTLEDILAGGTCPQSISSFSLINERRGAVVQDFYNSITLDPSDPDFSKWTIRANTFPGIVGSVVFRLDKKIKQTENVFPYTLKKRVLSFLKPGLHTLTTEVYSKPHKRGEQGIGRTATINIINSAAILNFEVVDTSGKVLMNLNDGDKININDPAFSSFSIRANTAPEAVGSVKFWLNHRRFRIENVVPYALNGDQNGDYYPWTPRLGDYSLLAIPYSKPNAKGYVGKSLKVHFKVVKEHSSNENKGVENVRNATDQESLTYHGEETYVSVYPVPVEGELFVKINNQAGNNILITIRNIHGQSVYTAGYAVQQFDNYSINTSGLQSGVYYLQILGSNGFGKVVKFIKK